jgi:hypothetical protein
MQGGEGRQGMDDVAEGAWLGDEDVFVVRGHRRLFYCKGRERAIRYWRLTGAGRDPSIPRGWNL